MSDSSDTVKSGHSQQRLSSILTREHCLNSIRRCVCVYITIGSILASLIYLPFLLFVFPQRSFQLAPSQNFRFFPTKSFLLLFLFFLILDKGVVGNFAAKMQCVPVIEQYRSGRETSREGGGRGERIS